jgi:hypothetical protein
MLRKTLLACGVLSSLLYVAMNVFVPMQWPGYSSAAQTVSELSARLMQMQGKFDPNTIQKLLEEMKANPNLSKEDLLKKLASQQSGLSPDQIEKFLPIL